MNKLVSAIITTHNRKNLLKRAIKSVFYQTYANIELIVVDDSSDDGTLDVCKDSRIKYIYIPKEESRGGNYARNIGIKAAKGDYCAFLDDDDYWLPTKIEKQVTLIECRDCELVHCGQRLEIVDNLKSIRNKDKFPRKAQGGNMSKRILFTIATTTSCILCKRSALLDVGMFDEGLKFWQEYELTIRLAQRKPFYYVDEPLTVYRIDTKDKGRLTNKFYDWKNAVQYVYNKHITIYNQLSFFERIAVKMRYLNDARLRSKGAGLHLCYLVLTMISFPVRSYLYLMEKGSI
ncbi:MAG: glycosyltransferase family 2 protein [Pseudobutyrivibrio sp.]|nr:glycosyltransferase family 2 protein [Pseudobutyrivibrio sp.]